VAELTDLEALCRAIRADTARKRRRGELVPLKRDPVTGKRPQGTGRYPTTGLRSPILKHESSVPIPRLEGRFRSRRERATELQARMAAFSAIYNAAYMVRDAYFGPDARRRQMIMRCIAVLLEELRATTDYEACLFALADALYASPVGVPWEP
jgi:hypothetical protein